MMYSNQYRRIATINSSSRIIEPIAIRSSSASASLRIRYQFTTPLRRWHVRGSGSNNVEVRRLLILAVVAGMVARATTAVDRRGRRSRPISASSLMASASAVGACRGRRHQDMESSTWCSEYLLAER